MATAAWIVNATPGEGSPPEKAIDIVLYGAGSGGGGGPVTFEDVSGEFTVQGEDYEGNLRTIVETFYNQFAGLQTRIGLLEQRVEELESGGAGAGAN